MQVDLRYGRGGLPLRLPPDARVTIIRKPPMPILADTRTAVENAFEHAVNCDSLALQAKRARTACIAICDITRPVPNHLFLRPMIEVLLAAGMSKRAIKIVVATGLHRPNQGAELRELVGDPWVLENVEVVNHFAKNDDEHVELGRTATRGTVVRIDRRFAEADLRIVTGLVEPHFMAGYSGGRKVIAPGLAHAETITTFHSARFMADPATANCNFLGNPLHEEQLEIVRMLGGGLALNTVIDEHRNLSFVNFGEVVASHEQAVQFARRFCQVEIDRKFETVVTCAAGYPLDKTYYQTIKGMVGAIEILAPGGDLIIASECSEGMGSSEFLEAQRRLIEQGGEQFMQQILSKSHADIDEWQTQMQLKPMSIGAIHLYSTGLHESDHLLTGVTRIASLQQAVEESLFRSSDRCVAIIPEGPYVVPVFSASLSANVSSDSP
jgi:lactate racemase